MRNYVFLFLLLFPSVLMYSRQIKVISAQEINKQTWKSGDTLIWQDGTYSQEQIQLKGDARSASPIVLQAQTSGKVLFEGESRLEMSGNGCVVEGFTWKNGYSKAGKAIVSFRSNNVNADSSFLKNCMIDSFNPSDETVDYKWVSVYGHNNVVENCTFKNKRNVGTLLVIWLDGEANFHQIRNNYFGERVPLLDSYGKEINGQEIIRIGDSSTSQTCSKTDVYNNFFENCDGEIEVISNKSCGNLYRNNLFYKCAGTLTLRHGNDCIVDGNYFLGAGKSATGGIRIIGENHKIYNNYLENLTGSGYRAALSIVCGIVDSPLSGYFQVKNCLIACNTILDCKSGLVLNYSSGSQTLSAENLNISLNVFSNQNANNNVLLHYITSEGIDGKLNIYDKGKISALTGLFTQYTSLPMNKNEDGIFIPIAQSVIFQTSSSAFPQIQTDIRGNLRTEIQCAGAFQNSSIKVFDIPNYMNTGVSWLKNETSSVQNIHIKTNRSYLIPLGPGNIKISNLLLDNHSKLYLNIFCLSGKFLKKFEVKANDQVKIGENRESHLILVLTDNLNHILDSKIVVNH